MKQINELWPKGGHRPPKYSPDRVQKIFSIIQHDRSCYTIFYLLDSRYLDYLWNQFQPDSSEAHILSLIYLYNHYFDQLSSSAALKHLTANQDRLDDFIFAILRLLDCKCYNKQIFSFLESLISIMPRSHPVRKALGPLFSVFCWSNLKYQHLVSDHPELEQAIQTKSDKYSKAAGKEKEDLYFVKTWLFLLITRCIDGTITELNPVLGLFISILSYIPTRRFASTLFRETGFLARTTLPSEYRHWLIYFIYYPVIDLTGELIPSDAVEEQIGATFDRLAAITEKHGSDQLALYNDPRKLILDFDSFKQCFEGFDDNTIKQICLDFGIEDYDFKSATLLKILWYGIADFRDYFIVNTSLHIPETDSVSVPIAGYIDTSDYIYRNVFYLKSQLEHTLTERFKSLKDKLEPEWINNRCKIKGSSKYAMVLSQAPIWDESFDTDSFGEPVINVQIVLNFKGLSHEAEQSWLSLKKSDCLYLLGFGKDKDITIHAKFNYITGSETSRVKRVYLTVKKMKDPRILSQINVLMRFDDDTLHLSELFNRYSHISAYELSLTDWMVPYLNNYQKHIELSDRVTFVKSANIKIDASILAGNISKKRSKTNKGQKDVQAEGDLLIEISPEEVISHKPVRTLWKPSKDLSLDADQTHAFFNCMLHGVTVVNGPINSGKTTVVQCICQSLVTNFNEKICVIVASEQQAKDLVGLLQENGISALDIGNRQSAKDHYSHLLGSISNFAKNMKVKYSHNESPSCLFTQYIGPKWRQYIDELSKIKPSTDDIVKKYPFELRNSNINKMTPQDAMLAVASEYNSMVEIFRDLKRYTSIEYSDDTSSIMSNVIVLTPQQLASLDSKLQGISDIIIMNAEHILPSDLFMSGSIENYSRIKRLLIVGNNKFARDDSCLKVFESSRVFNLPTQYHIEEALTKALEPDSKPTKKIQFIDINDSSEVSRSESYCNVQEAEMACYIFVYLRLLGRKCSEIAIITGYKLQSVLIREILQKTCGEYDVGNEKPSVLTFEDLKSRKFKYLVASFVQTTTHQVEPASISDPIRALRLMLNSVTDELYMCGNSLAMRPGFNKLVSQTCANSGSLYLHKEGSPSTRIRCLEDIKRFLSN